MYFSTGVLGVGMSQFLYFSLIYILSAIILFCPKPFPKPEELLPFRDPLSSSFQYVEPFVLPLPFVCRPLGILSALGYSISLL